MSKIDYSAVATGIQTVLVTQLSTLSPIPRIAVEKEFCPDEAWVGIYCTNRVPDNGQALAIASRQRHIVQFTLWVWRYAMTLPNSIQLRDALLSHVEVALMTDQTFGGSCVSSWMEGGRMVSATDPARKQIFLGGAEIILKCDCVAKSVP